jgi:tetratricopeptide (TPR) repeat protein
MGGTITNWKSSDWNPSRHVVAGSVGEIPGGGELGPRTASSEQGQLPPEATRSDIAQELVCLAWETSDLQRRVELAQAAIVVSSDCSDAYVLLAEMAADPAEARALHEKALTVAGRVLGAKAFSNDVGHFWGLFETRPYMRARAGLASCLWRLGDHAGAIAHYWELLRLNPVDNQGVRYVLMGCLLRTGQDEAAAQLLVSYAEDGDASWAYSAALLAFKKSGDTPETRALRSAAYEANGLVWPFLLGRRPIPKKLPEVIGVGDEGEAVAYAADYKPAWKKTPGAIEWFCAGAQAHNARPLH